MAHINRMNPSTGSDAGKQRFWLGQTQIAIVCAVSGSSEIDRWLFFKFNTDACILPQFFSIRKESVFQLMVLDIFRHFQ